MSSIPSAATQPPAPIPVPAPDAATQPAAPSPAAGAAPQNPCDAPVTTPWWWYIAALAFAALIVVCIRWWYGYEKKLTVTSPKDATLLAGISGFASGI